MKPSFSLPPNPSAKPEKRSSTSATFIAGDHRTGDAPKTDFNPTKPLTDHSITKQIAMECRSRKKTKNLHLPLRPDSNPNHRFEVKSSSPAGLNIRDSSGGNTKRKRAKRECKGFSSEAPEMKSKQREKEKLGGIRTWLTSLIRVRIISKDLKRGSLYLKKGQVVDVIGPTTCNVAMDENNGFIEGVDQDLLETALPGRGGPVLVVDGEHKGVYGKLVERDLDRDIALVQDADSLEFIAVSLDQVAEYVGDPSYIGY